MSSFEPRQATSPASRQGCRGCAAIREALPAVREALSWGEAILSSTAYLVGQSISAADVVYLPIIAGLVRALAREDAAALDSGILPLAGTYPSTAAWFALMEALPGYDNAFPPHWKE